MKILVACEFSGIVREAFKREGHDAWSCDLLPTEIQGNHIQGDVLDILDNEWDIMVAFPPCTHLSIAGCHLWKKKQKDGRQQEAYEFIKMLWTAPIKRICIENPVGWLNNHWMKPQQIIQPFEYGHPFQKRTCLWLKHLSKLSPTNVVEPTGYWVNSSSNYRNGAKMSNKGLHRNPKERSRSFQGIADAMATQWGSV